MLMIVVLMGILLAAFGVSGWMWFQLQRDAVLAEQNAAVPLADARTMQPLEGSVGTDNQKALDEQRLVYEDRLREAKEELEAAQLKAQEGERASAGLLDVLRSENEGLKANVAELQAASLAVSRDAAKLDHMIVENSALRAQVTELSAEVARSKETITSLEKESQQLKSVSKDVGDTQKLIDQAKEEYQRQLENVYKQAEDLRAENLRLQAYADTAAQVDGLRQASDELSGKVRELEMVNAIQAEKNEYLQYELTKSRAQVVGLERACETAMG